MHVEANFSVSLLWGCLGIVGCATVARFASMWVRKERRFSSVFLTSAEIVYHLGVTPLACLRDLPINPCVKGTLRGNCLSSLGGGLTNNKVLRIPGCRWNENQHNSEISNRKLFVSNSHHAFWGALRGCEHPNLPITIKAATQVGWWYKRFTCIVPSRESLGSGPTCHVAGGIDSPKRGSLPAVGFPAALRSVLNLIVKTIWNTLKYSNARAKAAVQKDTEDYAASNKYLSLTSRSCHICGFPLHDPNPAHND